MVRLSTYSQVVIANLLKDAVCPGCQDRNIAGRKHYVELNEHGLYCHRCGASWDVPARPRAEAVE